MRTARHDNELTVQRAHLMIGRGKLEEAERLLRQLQAQAPDAEVDAMLAAIRERRYDAKRDSERRRGIRYTLGIQTSWGRLCWTVGAICALVWGIWRTAESVSLGSEQGYGTLVTSTWRGRYGSEHTYTRPVFADVALYALLAVGGVAGLGVVRYASRGAAAWEELDAPDNTSSTDWMI